MDIGEIRKRIDLLDDVLLRIFNERARLALEIGHAKKELGLAVFDPAREKRIFNRMKEDNPGPLDDDAIIRMFERHIQELPCQNPTFHFSFNRELHVLLSLLRFRPT